MRSFAFGIVAEALAEELCRIVLGDHLRGDLDFHAAVVLLRQRAQLVKSAHIFGGQGMGGDHAFGCHRRIGEGRGEMALGDGADRRILAIDADNEGCLPCRGLPPVWRAAPQRPCR